MPESAGSARRERRVVPLRKSAGALPSLTSLMLACTSARSRSSTPEPPWNIGRAVWRSNRRVSGGMSMCFASACATRISRGCVTVVSATCLASAPTRSCCSPVIVDLSPASTLAVTWRSSSCRLPMSLSSELKHWSWLKVTWPPVISHTISGQSILISVKPCCSWKWVRVAARCVCCAASAPLAKEDMMRCVTALSGRVSVAKMSTATMERQRRTMP
mmetsp:Transcript_26017/g.56182  ORF Transcript_26017/g.56182 Transcript_26017/m.56182 type:complete len:217 (+) Transcript_26017:738-1388(+)